MVLRKGDLWQVRKKVLQRKSASGSFCSSWGHASVCWGPAEISRACSQTLL